MNNFRKILYPFSLLYGLLVAARNKSYDTGLFKSFKFRTPTIIVGNLNLGGTGKSPQIEYLIDLLRKEYEVAVLSRGYKRKTKGFYLADKNTTAKQIGDEPMQFHNKFEEIKVAVDADRVNGINQLNLLKNKPQVILLDDAFQHRRVVAGLNILLTTYSDLYIDDIILPAGNLRENKGGANRANIIIVSKCPELLSEKDQIKISNKLNPLANQKLFFTTIKYHTSIRNATSEISLIDLINFEVLLVTGIANAKPLLSYLESKKNRFKHLKYSDHHNFSNADKEKIKLEFAKLKANKKVILTTEKDYFRSFSNSNDQTYYLKIQTVFLKNEDDFNKQILNYVQQNTRNS